MPDDSRDSANNTDTGPAEKQGDDGEAQAGNIKPPKEVGGRDGADPTRYGDWEKRPLRRLLGSNKKNE